MKIGIIIQARMGSSRLPRKILKKIYKEETVISVLLHNLHKIENVKVIIAIPENQSDDDLEVYLRAKGELVYRGSEKDVLHRFIRAAEINQLDGIIRVCSDNPFLDYNSISELIKKAKDTDADYVGFKINNMPSIKTHFGFWGEFVTLDALKKVEASTAINSPAHEHVTIHVYSNPDIYKCKWIDCPLYLQGRDDIRLTIDTQEDFINARKIYSNLKSSGCNFSLKEIISYLDNNEKIKLSMLKTIGENKK